MAIIPPRRNQLLTKDGLPTQRFIEYLESLAGSTNDFTDQIDQLNITTDLPSPMGSIIKRLNDIDLALNLSSAGLLGGIPKPFKIIEITADYTTSSNEIIICNNISAITITLNPTPKNGETLHIKRRDSLITVNGPIDGDTTKNITLKYDAPKLVYTADAGEWSIL